MLLAFLLFGVLLSDTIPTVPLLPSIALAIFLLFIARPAAIALVLRKVSISRQAKLFIGWFGPRGLSTLLFGLLLVIQGVPGSEKILSIAGIVVIISVFLHGISAAPLANQYHKFIEEKVQPEERESTAAGLFRSNPTETPRVTVQELAQRLASEDPPILLDVRSRSSYDSSTTEIPGSIRVLPDEVIEWAAGKPHDRLVVAYCT
jgi:sodium/hydrogen antiporter